MPYLYSFRLLPLVALMMSFPAIAQDVDGRESDVQEVLEEVVVTASADASKAGLVDAYAGGQVAKGSRVGILGTRNSMQTPFSTIAYTNKLIRDKQARSIGEVLQNDPSVRVARGFGNFQEAYFIRGFVSESDDTLYNGLYGVLPRQYIATELFERVEVLRGASAFLNGMAPSGGNIGGSISVLPKRAPNEDLLRFSTHYGSGKNRGISADVATRFGNDKEWGVRLNVAQHRGGTSIADEDKLINLINLGVDWHGERARLSADLGWQQNRLERMRTNVTLSGLTSVPDAPGSTNWAQPWTYSYERDVFGTLRGEYDFSDKVTAYFAYGFRNSYESNELANLRVTNINGNGTVYSFDNNRRDYINTGEVGLRGKFNTGSISHEWVVAANQYVAKSENAYVMDFYNSLNTNMYSPNYYVKPAYLTNAFKGNTLEEPKVTSRLRLSSIGVGDTLGFLNDKLLLTLGVRLQKIDAKSYAYNTQILSSQYQKSRLSPAVGLVWNFQPQWSVYANYVESLAQGGTAATTQSGKAVVNAGEQLSPYVSKQQEIGLKWDSGRFGGGLAVFSTKKPRGLYIDAGNNQLRFTSKGYDRHIGSELNVYGKVSDDVKLLGGVTWLQAKQKSTGSATTDNKYTIGVPRLQANIGVEWEVPYFQGLILDSRVIYTGSRYADALNTLKVKGWTRWDLGVAYQTTMAGHEATFRARVDNVTNRKYWASVGGYPGYGYLVAGAPRSFSLSVDLDF